MQVELKSIKHAKTLSHETNAFTADVFINGIKVGYAENDGGGGMTLVSVRGNIEVNQKLVTQAEQHFASAPKRIIEVKGTKPFAVEWTLEDHINHLVHSDLVASDIARMRKLLEKRLLTHICFGDPNDKNLQYYSLKMPYPIAQLLTMKDGPEFLNKALEKAKKELKPGHCIFNKNIPSLNVTA